MSQGRLTKQQLMQVMLRMLPATDSDKEYKRELARQRADFAEWLYNNSEPITNEPIEMVYKGREIRQGVSPSGEPMLHFYENKTDHYGIIYRNETEKLLALVELNRGIDRRTK